MEAISSPQSIQEAIITPLVVTAQTTEERVTQLIADFQRELEETKNLTTVLKTTHDSLTKELEGEDRETKRLTEEHAAAMQALELRVNEMAGRIAQHQSSLATIAAEREQEQNQLKPLHDREAYLNSRNGVGERYQALCKQQAQAYAEQQARERAQFYWKAEPPNWNPPESSRK